MSSFTVKSLSVLFIAAFLVLPNCRSAVEPTRVLIGPFENEGPAEFDWLEYGLAAALRSDLERLAGPTDDVFGLKLRRFAFKEARIPLEDRSPEKLSRAARILGLNAICRGKIRLVGERLEARLQLASLKNDFRNHEVLISAGREDIRLLRDRLAIGVHEWMLAPRRGWFDIGYGKFASDDAGERIRSFYRPDAKAFALYGRSFLVAEEQPYVARDLLQEAFEIDPGFAEAAAVRAKLTAGHKPERLRGIELYEQVWPALERRGETGGRAHARWLVVLGGFLYDAGKLEESLAGYEEAESYLKRAELENTVVYSTVLSNRGILLNNLEKSVEALSIHREVQRRNEISGREDSNDHAHTLSSIGLALRDQEKYDEAIQYMQKARRIKILLGLDVSRGNAQLLYDLAGMYWSNEQRDVALEFFARSREVHEKIGYDNTLLYADSWNASGILLAIKGERKASRRAFDHSRRLYRQLGETERLQQQLETEGEIYSLFSE